LSRFDGSRGPGTSMDEPQVTLIYHRACSECQLVKDALDKNNVRYRARDIFDAPLSREELLVLLEGQDLKQFLNPRAGEIRARGRGRRLRPRGACARAGAGETRGAARGLNTDPHSSRRWGLCRGSPETRKIRKKFPELPSFRISAIETAPPCRMSVPVQRFAR